MNELPRIVGWAALHCLWFGSAAALLLSPFACVPRRLRPQCGATLATVALLAMALVFVGAVVLRPGGVLPGELLTRLGVDGAVDPRQRSLADAVATALGWICLAGLACAAVREVRAHRGLRRLLRGSRAVAAARLLGEHTWPELAAARIRIVARGPLSPCVAFVLRPVILVPIAVLRVLDREQLAAVLAHELAHVQRRDPIAHALTRLAAHLTFFHPLSRWLAERARRHREASCDDLAVHRCKSVRTYSTALLTLATASPMRARRSTALVLAAHDGELAERIERLLRPGPPARRRLLAASAALVAAAVLAAIGLRCLDLHVATARSERLAASGWSERPWARYVGGDRGILHVGPGIDAGFGDADAAVGCLVVLGRDASIREEAGALAPGSTVRGADQIVVDRSGRRGMRFAIDAPASTETPRLRARIGTAGWSALPDR